MSLGATYAISVKAQNGFDRYGNPRYGESVEGKITPCPGAPWAKSHRPVVGDIDLFSLDWSALGRRPL